MNRKIVKKLIILIIVAVVVFGILIILPKKHNGMDVINYSGKTYGLLEYKMDIFTYYHNSDNYYEEDIIHPVTHNKWDIVYFNDDLFILDKQVKEAIKYYKDDKNYDWYIAIDSDDSVIKKSIDINDSELNYLYDIEEVEEKDTIMFGEIDKFVDILKISKDGLVIGIINLVLVDDCWFYKTEIMTEEDLEYVVRIPSSLNKKINDLINNQ